uniref:Uncharacterized protein n=1 Tax=Salvator merianae TaxID=96440 RepID=A0A8D0CC22_SALMN
MLSTHREILILLFDAAVRYSMREAFLSSGNVSAYQSLTDNIYHGLPPLSNAVVRSVFASHFQLPLPLDPHGHRALMLFPWRTFLASRGPFPVTIDNLNPISYNMQLCLCGLSDEDRKVAHGELLGTHFAMEDALRSSYGMSDDRKEHQTFLRKQKTARMTESSTKSSKALLELGDSEAWQRSYLILWKQLEVIKAEWGRLKLEVEDIDTVPLYKQFSELYGAEILYPAMRLLAVHMGTEDEFEGFGTAFQDTLPPKEVSEMEIKTYQLQKLLESMEIHMIHNLQKKINKEITLVISEKTREERNLPTELWKHHNMQETFSVPRPEIVESFVQRIMKQHREIDDEELQAIEDRNGNAELSLSQLAGLSHEMIMEITALRSRLADLQEEDHNLKEKIRKEVQEDYEALVQNIFLLCVQLKGKVDEYRLNMSQRMFEIISEVRKEGVDKMIDMKRKFGFRQDSNALKEHLAQQGHLQELRDENSQLETLLCKLKTMSCWKATVQKVQLSTTLREVEKEAFQNKKEYLESKAMAEQEAVLFRQELKAARKALLQCQTENKGLQQQLDKQEYLVQELEHKLNQEVCRRQHLDLTKTKNLEKMLEGLGERELKLQQLTEEAEKSSKIRQLQGKKEKKEIQQIRSRLAQERSLKLDAFQRVEELQCQLYDLEEATTRRSSPGGSIAARVKSANRLYSARSLSHCFSDSSWKQDIGIPTFTLTRDFRRHLLTACSTGGSTIKAEKMERPKTVPPGWRNTVVEALRSDLTENSSSLFAQHCKQKTAQQ